MKRIIMMGVLAVVFVVQLLAHAQVMGIFRTKTHVEVIRVKMQPGTSKACDLTYVYNP